MFNPTWLYTGAAYAGAVWLARRGGVELPVRVAAFFYALVFVFFYPVLTQDMVNTSVDYLGTLPPWEYTVDDHRAGNVQLNDLALQIVPWAHQVREGWRSLTPPLWNHFSGAGYPLLASAQSSALSPLRLAGLPLSLAHAMSFEAAMKVLIALTFTFLWCRRRGYSEVASAAGAVAFGFSMFIIVWLHFPLATTACLVPAVFYLLDLLAESVTYARVAALGATGAAMLFGGHPETVSHTAFFGALYVLWLVFVERRGARLAGAVATAAVIAALLAAPFLAPFAEAVTKSKRYQELQNRIEMTEVPHTDWPSAILLLSPHLRGPGHAEAITGFAGIFGVAAWFAVAAHVVRARRWRSREMFLVLASLIALGVILDWPLIGDAFHLLFTLAANARVRLMLVLFLAILTAAAIDLLARERRNVLLGMIAAAALLAIAYATAETRHVAAMVPSMAVLAVGVVACASRVAWASQLALLTIITFELWRAGGAWNPVVSDRWMYPKTPLIEALDRAAADVPETAPFRIVGNAATFFPNVSAVYGYEDVRAHDPMSNGRYIGLLAHVVGYDPTEYFAHWPDWEHPLLDYLGVRYVLTSAGGELPHGFRRIHDGNDGRLFENDEVMPRFFAVPNVIIVFDDADYARRLKEHPWADTALLDRLEVEAPEMHDDFFKPRPADAPRATVRITEASPTSYRMHVRAPRWSMVVSSVPWWPGWKVERNGARAEPIRVNGAFLGFAVPPGELDVRVWYDPWTFRAGAIVAAATAAALIAWGLRKRS